MSYISSKKFFNSIKRTQKKQEKWNQNIEQKIIVLQENLDNITQLLEAIQKKQDGITKLRDSIQEKQNEILNLHNTVQNQNSEIIQIQDLIQESQNEILDLKNNINDEQKITKEVFANLKTEIQKDYEFSKKSLETTIENTNEIVWSCIFNNAISGATWLKDKSFYPGRWAIGYPVLYVLYRILNEVKPKTILELGLGQSTRMITQYAAAHQNVKHYVVEHDEAWIHFFERDMKVAENTQIVKLNREERKFLDAENVRQFCGFKKRFQTEKFDFIFIDAPLSGDMKQYARVDALSLIPQNLRQSFVILMDDYQRIGEKNTGKIIEDTLRENGINYIKGFYMGQKQMAMWASEDYAFLRTM